MAKTTTLSATSLKELLWATINDVKTETLEAESAKAISGGAKQILQTVKLQLQIAAQTARSVPVDVVAFSEAS